VAEASFHIHRNPDLGSWVVEEEASRHIGGLFVTLAAALDYVSKESRRFARARVVIELSPCGTHAVFTRRRTGSR
jgi:hypothetical protein